MNPRPEKILEIAEQIWPLLANQDPVLQSAVLAELLSLLLAGYWIPGDHAQTANLRESILKIHCRLVRELVQVNSEMMGTDTYGNPA